MNLQQILDASMDDLRKRFAHLNSRMLMGEAGSEDEKEMVMVWRELQLRGAKELNHIPVKTK